MTSPYPITDQRSLSETLKQGIPGFRSRRREYDELPQAEAHQVFVYRVDGEYIVDNGRRDLDDEQVVAATHVSLVDVRRNMPVRVELGIPSAEASEFTIQATFACTVTDPATVVREGQYDAGDSLLNYLRSHHRIFQLGLDHKMSAINTVRRDVQSQVEAYTQLKPPRIPGMSASLSSVEVLTPEELVEFHKTLRGKQRDHELAFGEQQYSHDLKRAQEQNEQLLEQMTKRNEQELEQQRQMFEQLLAQQRRTFIRDEVAEVSGSVGDDPLRAATRAHAAGEMTSVEFMKHLEAAKELERAAAQARMDQEREDRLRELEQQRADAQQRESWVREDRLHALNVRLDVLKEVAKHGHLDEIYVDVERLIGTLVSATDNAVVPVIGAAAPGKEKLAALQGSGDDAGGNDDDPREEE